MASAVSDRRRGLTGDKGYKAPVDLATTANITLAGEQTIDGVLTAGSRVLVKNQTNTTQNGVYDSSSGAWTRAIDANGNQDLVKGTQYLITGGSQAYSAWVITSANQIIPGTSPITFIQSLSSAFLETEEGQELLLQSVSIVRYGAVGGGADDSQAFRAAAATGKRVLVPAGTWLCNVVDLPAAYFFGEGESSIVGPYNVGLRCFGCDSGGASTFIDGFTVRDLKFLGTLAADGFSEQVHLIWVNGVRRLRVIDCYFVDPRGDCLYIGSGPGGGSERHNLDVIVRGCHFDGLTAENRNGISVIDVDGMEISGCTFKNLSRFDMPGSIDFEPDHPFGVVKNIRIFGNYFYNCNGINAHISFATQYTENIGNWQIHDNVFELAASAILFNLKPTAVVTATQNVQIHNNIGYLPAGNFVYKRAGDTKGWSINDNTVRALRCVWMSKTDVTAANDAEFFCDGNIFYASGVGSFGVLCSENLTNSSISGNTFSGSENYHIRIGSNGDAEYLTINDNQFYGTPTNGDISHQPAVNTNASTHTCLGNQWGSTHTFVAARTDFTGSVQNPTGIDTTALPSAFPYGQSMTRISAQTVDGASQTGMLYTHKPTSAANTAWWQEFIPDYSATYKDDRYFRKAVDASTWDAWWQVTGT